MSDRLTSSLLSKLRDLHVHLDDAGFEHAVGGGIALAFHAAPRFTNDIDLNVAADPTRIDALLAALPEQVVVHPGAGAELRRTEQVRLFWPDRGQATQDGTPIDLFLPAHPTFHHQLNARAERVTLGGVELAIVTATDLTILKALFDRAKDWVDIEAMLQRGTVDVDEVQAWLAELLGADDSRIDRLRRLAEDASR
ncbi:nucleotidyl transferase AbiEii/AbiGii toxin family protein [Aeromicrobium sp. CF4.19]|uniref:nucleotidyl transferase AbiEii/AbiGii toxin family protein n=1 Tax=Aeromicrobium sp. CF4.19 TaxID=3373082 RepID=UPI003EE44649